ncbi:MAG: (2Fe-2S)-binding protein [Prolixibacteraceae bacterium]|nr:(2Fe-2S)-binding protein [Prolixibacteraceae bacterium]
MSKRLVCICNMVTEKEIHTALVKGARSTSDIQKITRAGTSCGRCLPWIDLIVEEFLENLPDESQQRIDFGE